MLDKKTLVGALNEHITNNKILLDEGLSVDIDVFLNEFKEVENFDYESLVAADWVNDEASKGYKRFFDKWKEQGILN